jgi:hypothetical protein
MVICAPPARGKGNCVPLICRLFQPSSELVFTARHSHLVLRVEGEGHEPNYRRRTTGASIFPGNTLCATIQIASRKATECEVAEV